MGTSSLKGIIPAPDNLLDDFRGWLEGFASSHLENYTRELGPSSIPRFSKEFNDSIWLTIKVRSPELVLVDSPLFQRLRHIRQLGVAHWVYPGTTHTRFEHSLGVLSRVQELVNAINNSQMRSPVIDEETTNRLRLAALCHDLGHGFMSHVSENALVGLKGVDDLRAAFRRKHKHQEKVQLSEMAAFYLVGSPAFRAMIARGSELLNGNYGKPTDALLMDVQKLIVGQPICDRIPLLHELISGPFDADKLDYMTRDARLAGVPVVTDIPRLIQKVRAIEVAQETLPPEVQPLVGAGLPSYILTGIALSGGRTLDELMLGRTLLFDKVYRHHKVRAVEGMVASLVRNLVAVLPGQVATLPFRLRDDEVLSLSEGGLRDVLGLQGETTPEQKTYLRTACDLSRRLRERRLFVRAFAFAQNVPQDAYRQEQTQRHGLDEIMRLRTNQGRRQQVLAKIAAEAKAMMGKLGVEPPSSFADPTFNSYLWLDPPGSPASPAQVSRALLLTEENKVIRFKDDSAEVRGWADAYLLTNDIGYAFCAREIRTYVHLATEKIFREDFGVKMDPLIINYAKQDGTEVETIRRRLADAGHYQGSPHDLRPIPARLKVGDVMPACRKVCETLRGYEGPGGVEGEGRPSPLNEVKVQDWLKQFADDDIIASALKVIGHVRLVGRDDCLHALDGFLRLNPAFVEADICSLGGAKDSGAVVTYYAGDMKQKHRDTRVSDLSSALRSGRPVIFTDDLLGSGRQAREILLDRLGLNVPSVLGEAPRGHLDPTGCERLRSGAPLAFVFAAALDEGVKALDDELTKQGVSASIHAGLREQQLPTVLEPKLFGNDLEQQEKFLVACRKIGRSLLSDPNQSQDEDRVQTRVLGYGNRGLLITFPYNTPSQALTCLWKEGQYNGALWQPLLPRRKKS